MRLGLFLILLCSFFVGNISIARACVNWCAPKCQEKGLDGSCVGGYVTNCGDNGGCGGGGGNTGWETTYCDPGQYSCNRSGSGYCCDYGTSGPGPQYTCDWVKQNCPVGQVKDTTGGYSDYCGLITGCPGAGSA